MKKIKNIFRELCGPWVYKSKIVKRAFEKPRGYPGDYKLLEIIYDNKIISDKIGYCYDKYFVNNEFAVAVRNRKDRMKKILKEFILNSDSKNIHILNLACGSCREIKELLIDDKFMPDKKINFTLVDQDQEALEYCKKIFTNSPKEVSFNFFQNNILNYILKKNNKNSEILNKYDLIYTIGLADYLPDRILKNLLLFCFNLLEFRGKFIIAHKDTIKYKPLAPDWWADWTFYKRDESYLLNIINKSGIKNFEIIIHREPEGIIFFLTITKTQVN